MTSTAAPVARRRSRARGGWHLLRSLVRYHPRLFAIARRQGFGGRYIELMRLIARRAEKVHARPLPINATGAIGAIACEMGLPWQACRGIGVMARAVGLVGHALEELRQPLATEVWHRTEAEATAAIRGQLKPAPRRASRRR